MFPNVYLLSGVKKKKDGSAYVKAAVPTKGFCVCITLCGDSMRTGLVSWHQRGGMAPEGRVVSGHDTRRAVLGAPGVAPLVARFREHRSPRRA